VTPTWYHIAQDVAQGIISPGIVMAVKIKQVYYEG
ncbi:unnamed protein product, partial [marine sediment metagenome]